MHRDSRMQRFDVNGRGNYDPPQDGSDAMMQMEGYSSPVLHRQRLERLWRARFDQAFQRYHSAANEHRSLRQAKTVSGTSILDRRLERARRAELEARMEYCRVLKIFTYLASHGRLPKGGDEDGTVLPRAG